MMRTLVGFVVVLGLAAVGCSEAGCSRRGTGLGSTVPKQIPDIDLPEGFSAFVFYDAIPGPDGIVVSSDESLIVVNEFGPDGPFVVSAPRGGSYSTEDALSTIGPPLVSPDDLEAGAGGQLFIADGQARTIFRLPQGGQVPIPFVTHASTGFDSFNPFGVEVVPPSFDGPSVDPGDLIVADNGYRGGGRIWAVNQETGVATVLAQGAVFEGGPLQAEFGPDGTLYVFENFQSGSKLSRIVTVAGDGTAVPFVEQIPARGGLAVHPKNGDVYFLCGAGLVCRVVHGTTTPEQFASNVGPFQSLEFSQSGLSLFVGAAGRVIEIRGDEQSWGAGAQCDDGTQAGYESEKCQACVACSSQGLCRQCNAKSCQDFLGCAMSCPDVACTADCIDRYPAGAHLFGQSLVCGLCDTCPNNCGFPPPPFWCDSVGLPCYRDDECTGSQVCCQTGGPFMLGACVTQAACDELQGR
jgi:hypothetical protein